MEGISDGGAVDTCFYCMLLYPRISSCPHCRQAMRYESATMLGSDELQTQLDELYRAFQCNPHQNQARQFLSFVHRFGDEAIEYTERQFPEAIPSMRELFDSPSP